MAAQKQYDTTRKGNFLPAESRLTQLADIYFKIGLVVSFFLFPCILLLGLRDLPLFISTLTLAVAIPTLAFANTAKFMYGRMSKSVYILGIAGSVSCFIGLIAAFWHLSWIAGATFFLAALIGDVVIAYLD